MRIEDVHVGDTFGPGPWLAVEQSRIDAFAGATGDDQWIHVDPARAAAGPFGGTVAHGYLTLSLLPLLARDLYTFEGLTMALNYGLNRVRFPAPLPSGASVRATAEVVSLEPAGGAVQLVMRVTVHSDRGEKPVCVAETVSRLYP
ncbi:MaoC family dehydratase [Spirilliplanes yamanashiensis]|uniref:MaoC family dehydratase n=1 Tax=Spirilliplanes yamanashiensis TaxID=42233 RepID=A0A8J4DFV1_9ACTN|nr:MaoC family dehydratase [Spirilliplanes yamanashiensis]MDP9814078.1 acyl dehydratase [Spirilliplanes yamanashiensis]GIJ00942.1 MaoC family dehydratase [Spirilliplanes yamanashiensis]